MSNALDRIAKLDEVKPELSIDEQMAAAEETINPANSDFFGGMSPEAAEAMNKSIKKENSLLSNEIKFENIEQEMNGEIPIPEVPVEETPVAPKEELFNNNIEEKPRRGRHKKEESMENNSIKTGNYNPIMDQLAKDLLEDLKKRKYTIGNFSSEQTKLIIDYIYDKI